VVGDLDWVATGLALAGRRTGSVGDRKVAGGGQGGPAGSATTKVILACQTHPPRSARCGRGSTPGSGGLEQRQRLRRMQQPGEGGRWRVRAQIDVELDLGLLAYGGVARYREQQEAPENEAEHAAYSTGIAGSHGRRVSVGASNNWVILARMARCTQGACLESLAWFRRRSTQAVLAGVVRADSIAPCSPVEVLLEQTAFHTTTDSAGRFVLPGLSAGVRVSVPRDWLAARAAQRRLVAGDTTRVRGRHGGGCRQLEPVTTTAELKRPRGIGSRLSGSAATLGSASSSILPS
jgi:hypothetical protein